MLKNMSDDDINKYSVHQCRDVKEYIRVNGLNWFPIYRTPDSQQFQVSVNVAARKEVTFYLKYEEVLQLHRGHYEHVIHVVPGQPVSDLHIQVDINEPRSITELKGFGPNGM